MYPAINLKYIFLHTISHTRNIIMRKGPRTLGPGPGLVWWSVQCFHTRPVEIIRPRLVKISADWLSAIFPCTRRRCSRSRTRQCDVLGRSFVSEMLRHGDQHMDGWTGRACPRKYSFWFDFSIWLFMHHHHHHGGLGPPHSVWQYGQRLLANWRETGMWRDSRVIRAWRLLTPTDDIFYTLTV